MLKRLFIIFLYCCYGLVLVGVLLFFFFPRDRFLIWVAERVEQKLPGFECRIEQIRYVHPFKLGLYQIFLDNPAERISIPIDTLLASFEMKWPVEEFQVSAVLYGGAVESVVTVNGKANRFELTNLSVTSVQLQGIDFVQKRLDRQIRGTYSMSGDLKIDGSNQPEVVFDGIIEIDQFFTKLRRPVLGFSEIDFTNITADVHLDRNTFDISAGRYKGELISGEFSGVIMLQNPWQQSTLDMKGGVIPEARLLESDPQLTEAIARLYREYRQEAIPCRIEGTVQEPEFRFGSK